MKRRFQESQLYADFRDLAMVVLFTDSLVGIAFFAFWKFTATLWHR